ncbi:hypothetical protein OH460_08485 [Vibrio sp. Makdt]|uniref:hypothetical protein n=1 Tax=Vibrio sp. Makdt TaxID=2998828 RepID=UPI0022CD692E|nr:hypothetical protein [Vibrio sp. Makdt]MDA0152337.1 hypothetical protein [Vibrio sp. Makdt]
MNIRLLSIALVTTFGLTACQSTSNQTHFLYLQDQVIANSIDFDQLYDQWIDSKLTKNNLGVYEFPTQVARTEAINSLKDGVERYCDYVGGSLSTEKIQYGESYKCDREDHPYIAVSYKRYNDNLMSIYPSTTSARLKAEESRKNQQLIDNKIKELKLLNGPGGTLVLETGHSVEFIRMGTVIQRDLMHLGVKQGTRINDYDYTYIDDVASIDFENKTFTKTSGDITEFDVFGETESANRHSLSVGVDGLAIVTVDPKNDQLFVLRFPNLNGVASITFEQSALEGGMMATQFDTKPYEDELNAYLALEAAKIQSERDWSRYVDFNNLPPKTVEKVVKLVNSIADDGYGPYLGDNIDGFKYGPYVFSLSQLAMGEVSYLNKGYKFTNETTPLASYILMAWMKLDVDGNSFGRITKSDLQKQVFERFSN